MKKNLEVDRWFAAKKHPLEKLMQRVREILLRADPRITEYVKYGTPTFAYGSDMAVFVRMKDKRVTLMFNRGGSIPGRYPHLTGEFTPRFMQFLDLAGVDARAGELEAIVGAWCAMQGPASVAAKAKPARSKKGAAKRKPAARRLRG